MQWATKGVFSPPNMFSPSSVCVALRGRQALSKCELQSSYRIRLACIARQALTSWKLFVSVTIWSIKQRMLKYFGSFLAPFGAATSLKYVVSEVHIWLTFAEISFYCTGILCTAFGSFCRFFCVRVASPAKTRVKIIKTGCLVSTCLCLVRLWPVLFILSCSPKNVGTLTHIAQHVTETYYINSLYVDVFAQMENFVITVTFLSRLFLNILHHLRSLQLNRPRLWH